ncbi:type VI secretion system baseplate subunit TssG [Hymenobacter chitinivorans]|uniref:Type VI secretion system (T6SS) VasB/ImpH family protein n=1 Tax=Hymenobacter chitinivorans DSM 11115 TaxID=1121954 RepID=A0A2M9BN61_9BACT|nr:type VI secretion system baseplate subunit TssG [Hymenobacter chitinivorans]PJJ59350.1 type VI secretion system (T6SS) VasB/ImpH family protein [Hymenobacter chitinivorans DSM 11115]
MPKSSPELVSPEVRPAAPAARPVSTLQQLFTQLRRRPIDLRLEVVLADLLAHGYQFDDFIIRPLSLFARRYRRDLGATTEEQTNRWSSPKTTVEVHREGLYDALPQELFHHPSDPTPRPGVQPMVEEIQTQRRKEKAARRFFLPLEQEFYRFRVLLEQEERRYMTNLSAEWYNEVLARFWNLEGQLPARQVTALLYLLPLAHRITGDLELTRRCFESVLETPVVLRTVAPLRFATPAPAAPAASSGGLSLGNLELGRQFVLGGLYQETLPALEISLPDLTTAALESFLSDTWQARALQLLCQYFIAFETDVVLRYEVAQEEPAFVLADADGEAPVLGYTTAGI